MSEVRLIDANALKDAHIECPDNISFFDFGEIVERFLQTVDDQPTVDAVPVVHGYWRPHPLGYTSNLVKYEEWDVCSNCGIGTKRRNMTDDFFEEYSYSFCPNCGARMKDHADAD